MNTSLDNIDFLIDRGDDPEAQREPLRKAKDNVVRALVRAGGVSVIFVIMLIFYYLFSVVVPIFKSAEVDFFAPYESPISASDLLHLESEEQAEIGFAIDRFGKVTFFDWLNGDVVDSQQLISEDQLVDHFLTLNASQKTGALVFAGNDLLFFKQDYELSYPDDKRVITPDISFPYGEDSYSLDTSSEIQALGVGDNDYSISLVSYEASGQLILSYFAKEEDLFGEGTSLALESIPFSSPLSLAKLKPDFILLDNDQRWLYLADNQGNLDVFELDGSNEPEWRERSQLLNQGQTLTSLKFLTGELSLLAGDSSGKITQWFPVRQAEGGFKLTAIRSFELDAPVVDIITEQRRKGFVALDAEHQLHLLYATSERHLLTYPLNEPVAAISLSPRSNSLAVAFQNNTTAIAVVDNEHPEVSFSSLWQKVWYEGYSEPDYIWQSSAANNDFEPKFSLVPLSFGTLKAAFFTMLVAMPLAIMGAIYTAYFMAPKMRTWVKPSIEIMEALPTVILGFLAGLWLAPFAEANLVGIFATLLLLPIGLLAASFCWWVLPLSWRQFVSPGWQALLLVPVVILTTWVAIALGPWFEALFFQGDIRQWLGSMGIDFDQRNALVVGMVMGFAVIPTIFSVAEDAVFSVPSSLSNASLAMGATPWQTMQHVVLPAASPGIFSAVVIGFGRAVGETMIVLMATGNTAIMDINIFEGMRTLSANLAVELPESEVGSTHFRILFLASLVLLVMTFFLNTLAEMVRHRLRKRYSAL